MRNAIVVLLMLTAAQTAVAGQSLTAPRPTTRLGALRHAQRPDPYRKLFPTQSVTNVVESAVPKADTKPSVVCGMTIIPADPSLDPKMLFPRKADGVDYKLRVITPPTCNPAR